ncbi:glycosyltransferase family 4 protein [Candidatus Saccharibacteria bacterium]|nr:MAG: glycosyltransferase family 4 protein [Candidatus Saccharibacteria bacterium]
MHIVIDARIINSSTGRYIERLLTYLQTIDHDNHYTVLVPSKDMSFWQPTAKNFTLQAADYANYSFNEQFGFKKFLERLEPDLVHFCMPQQPVLYRGKTITTFHDLTLLKTWNSDKNWIVYHIKQLVGRLVFFYVARKNTALLVPSEYTKQDLLQFSHVSPTKITVTYEAADITPTQAEPYPLPYKHFLLYVGQQPDYKNIRRLAAAHQKLLAAYPHLGLVLAGRLKDDAKANRNYFEKQGYKNIHFTDYVSDEQRDWLYQHCEAYCFPSLMEGFGLPGLEAMAHGAPVVASNATCIPEILGDAALYFDPYSIDDIVHSLQQIISNKKLRSQLVARGYSQVKKYSWRRTAEQTHAAYLDALRHN